MYKFLIEFLSRILRIDRVFDRLLINQGVILRELHRSKASSNLKDFEFKVFSQWGEDGIIQHLIENLQIANKTFVEFGVEDFRESNCRYLLMQSNWSGLVLDGSKTNIEKIKRSYFYWQHNLTATEAFVDKDNIDGLLLTSGFSKDLGLLSIDIDGIDYFVLEALHDWSPSILIVEYNGVFGPDAAVTVPYDSKFRRTSAHYSNLYWGASLRAFCHLANKRNYALVGTNSAGSNAFFVQRKLLNDRVQEVDPYAAYTPTTFRESRGTNGKLSFLAEKDRRLLISDMTIIDVTSGQEMHLRDIFA